MSNKLTGVAELEFFLKVGNFRLEMYWGNFFGKMIVHKKQDTDSNPYFHALHCERRIWKNLLTLALHGIKHLIIVIRVVVRNN